MEPRPANKRDRPLSSCFDSPAAHKWSDRPFVPSSPTKGVPDFAEADEEETDFFASPVRRRKPFRNITTLVNSWENSVRSKLMSAKMPFLSRSSTLEGAQMKSGQKTQTQTASQTQTHSASHTESCPSTHHSPYSQLAHSPSPLHTLTRQSPQHTQTHSSQPAHKHIAVPPPPATIRRIHSMCQTSRERETCARDNNSHLASTNIVHFKVDNDLFPRIEADQLERILSGNYENPFDEVLIVDCRFEYEYNGGHIDGAINLITQDALEDHFMANHRSSNSTTKRLCVFHCEFSVFRGPTMASHLRKCDRIANSDSYPHLSYPDIVILEGGYERFFSKYTSLCVPQAYVEMRDINHQHKCEEELTRARKSAKLTRAKSFHQFGAQADPPQHSRSKSYTTVTSQAENLKVLKRHRSSSRVNVSQRPGSLDLKLSRASTFSHPSVFNSSPATSPVLSGFNALSQDFQPPTAQFRATSLRQSTGSNYSLSCSSIDSSSSLSSDHVSAFSSTDSLTDTFTSPVFEPTSFFDTHTLSPIEAPNSVLRSATRKPKSPLPTIPNAIASSPELPLGPWTYQTSQLAGFKFPQKTVKTTRSQSHSRVQVIAQTMTSPSISSPLSSFTPMSTLRSLNSSQIIDPINESPVDFSVPTPRASHQKFSGDGGLHRIVTLDIDEVDEEDEGNDTTVTDILEGTI